MSVMNVTMAQTMGGSMEAQTAFSKMHTDLCRQADITKKDPKSALKAHADRLKNIGAKDGR
jgi:hypothetical protein